MYMFLQYDVISFTKNKKKNENDKLSDLIK